MEYPLLAIQFPTTCLQEVQAAAATTTGVVVAATVIEWVPVYLEEISVAEWEGKLWIAIGAVGVIASALDQDYQ